MKSRLETWILLTASLLILSDGQAQHAQKDIDLVSQDHQKELEQLREAWPFFNVSSESLMLPAVTDARLRVESRRFFKSEALVYVMSRQTSQNWDGMANGGMGDWLNESRFAWTRSSGGQTTGFLVEDWDPTTDMWVPSFRRRTIFSEQNRPTEDIDEDWDPDANGGQGAWIPSGRAVFTYNEQGNLLVNTTEIYDESSGMHVIFWRTTRTYDTSGQFVIQSLFETAFSGPLQPSTRRTFEYDGNGNVTREFIESYDSMTSQWQNSTNEHTTYDSNEEVVEQLREVWDETLNDWVNNWRTQTVFTPNSSDPTEIVETDQSWDSGLGDWMNVQRYVTTFTTGGETNTIVDLFQTWDPTAPGKQGAWINDSRSTFIFTSAGNFVEIVDQNWDPAAGGGQGDWVNEWRDTFVEDQRGLIVENLTEEWDGTQWVNYFRLLLEWEELAGVAVEDDQPALRYALEANYPNPFSQTTTIRFELSLPEHVTLEVFDVLGRRVLKPVDGPTTAGRHEVTIEGAELAGGMYFYRLRGEGINASRTMVLMR